MSVFFGWHRVLENITPACGFPNDKQGAWGIGEAGRFVQNPQDTVFRVDRLARQNR
jgi:hypothetical protein